MKKYLMVLIISLISIGFVAADIIVLPSPSLSKNTNPIDTRSSQEINCTNSGSCFDRGTFNCYPKGYVKNGTYCTSTSQDLASSLEPSLGILGHFVNQSKEGQTCSQNYECDTNLCSNNICVNLTKQIDELNKLKQEINSLNNSLSNLTLINNTETLNNTPQLNSLPLTGNAVANQNEGLVNRIINFFKGIFGIK